MQARLTVLLLVALAFLAQQAACDCELRPNLSLVLLNDWRAMPTGTGGWTIQQGGLTAVQYPTGSPSFLVSDDFLDGRPVRGTLRASGSNNSDGYIGFAVGLSCGPEQPTPVDHCYDSDAVHVIWGRGTESANPGLCLVRENFPGFSPCPLESFDASTCTDPNASLSSSTTLPTYGNVSGFLNQELGCCDRFCDAFGHGLGWEADRDYDVIIYQTADHVRVLVDMVDIFNYQPSLVGDDPMAAMSRLAFVSDSTDVVTFTSLHYMESIVSSCGGQFDFVLSFLPCGEDGGETLHVVWGDGSVVEVIEPVGHAFVLSHVFSDSPAEPFVVQLSLVDNTSLVREVYDLVVFVIDPPVLEVELLPSGACDSSMSCSNTGHLRVTRLYGGVAPYVIDWGSDTLSTVQHQCNGHYECNAEMTGMPPGVHDVVVTDANGCTFVLTVDLMPTPIDVELSSVSCGVLTATTDSQASCNGFDYSWSTDAYLDMSEFTSPHLYGLPPGHYRVTATDANACSASASFEMSYGFTSPHAGDAIFLYAPFQLAWTGFSEGDTGGIRIVCGDQFVTLFHGDLGLVTSVEDAVVHGLTPGECRIVVGTSTSCIAYVEPVYICAGFTTGPEACRNTL